MIEPSDAEQATWPDATRAYVAALLARIAELDRPTVVSVQLHEGGATLKINPPESDAAA